VNLIANNKESAADAAASEAEDDAAGETSDDGWIEDTPEQTTTSYDRTPEKSRPSYSASSGRSQHKPNLQQCVLLYYYYFSRLPVSVLC